MNNSSLVWLFGNRVVFCSSKTPTLYTAATLYTVKYCLYDHSIKRTTPLQSTTQYKGPPRCSRPLNIKDHPATVDHSIKRATRYSWHPLYWHPQDFTKMLRYPNVDKSVNKGMLTNSVCV